MSQLVVVAFPQAAAKIMLIDENQQGDSPNWMCWGHELITEVPKIIQESNAEITSVLVFGPVTYVQVIAEGLQNVLPNITVEIGDM